MLTRFPDWPDRLAGAVNGGLTRAFAWGRFDCCLFACDGVAAITGVDPAAELRGRYTTQLGAARVLKRFAGGGLAEAADKIAGQLGAPAIAPSRAQRGDVVLVETEHGPALGIIAGGGAFFPAISGGLASRDPIGAVKAWRV